jgi:hypothetical protein
MGLRPHYYHPSLQKDLNVKCADPTLCYTDTLTGKRQFRHFSLSSTYFKLIHNQVFNCGKCLFCRKKKSYELAIRCVLHASMYKLNCFLTLTYDEAKPGYHNEFNYPDIQKFKKRLRHHVKYYFNNRIDVFNVHEYGKNGKKHWHLVVFGHDFKDKTLHTTSGGLPLYTSSTLEKLWPYGFNTIGDVSEASAMYQAQYMEKDIKNGNTNNKKKSDSQHRGIGKPFFLANYKQILSLGYIPFACRKIPMPRSFEKIAHKHWSHFNEPSNFFDTKERKKLYTPFKQGLENKEISDLFNQYITLKRDKITQLEEEWDNVISHHLETKEKPEFIKSAENALYDLNNKNNQKDKF